MCVCVSVCVLGVGGSVVFGSVVFGYDKASSANTIVFAYLQSFFKQCLCVICF